MIITINVVICSAIQLRDSQANLNNIGKDRTASQCTTAIKSRRRQLSKTAL